MYLVRTADAVGHTAITRALEGLIRGLFIQGHSNIRSLWEDHWTDSFERYAELCIQGAFAGNLPETDDDGVPLSKALFVDMVERAMGAVYDFRSDPTIAKRFLSPGELSQIAIECRWMLEGFLGISRDSESKGYRPSQWAVGLYREETHRDHLARLISIREEFEELKHISSNTEDDKLKEQVMAEMIRQIEEGVEPNLLDYDEIKTKIETKTKGQKTTLALLKRNMLRAYHS